MSGPLFNALRTVRTAYSQCGRRCYWQRAACRADNVSRLPPRFLPCLTATSPASPHPARRCASVQRWPIRFEIQVTSGRCPREIRGFESKIGLCFTRRCRVVVARAAKATRGLGVRIIQRPLINNLSPPHFFRMLTKARNYNAFPYVVTLFCLNPGDLARAARGASDAAAGRGKRRAATPGAAQESFQKSRASRRRVRAIVTYLLRDLISNSCPIWHELRGF